jgi:nucleotide-binding universal stress UspA family protein
MNAEGVRPEIRRILVALDASAGSLAALEGAATLAARWHADLLGIFIEDEDLLRLAALPFAEEVEVLFARTRPLRAEEMEQRLRAQAQRAEEALSLAAERHRLRWEFRVVRGAVTHELLAAIEDVDLAALGGIGGRTVRSGRLGGTALQTILRAERPVLLLAPGGAIREPIAVLYNDRPSARRALALAARLAQKDGGALLVLIDAADPKAHAELARAAQAQLETLAVEAHVRSVGDRRPEALAAVVRRERIGTVILPGEIEQDAGEMACRLVEGQSCAVILVR